MNANNLNSEGDKLDQLNYLVRVRKQGIGYSELYKDEVILKFNYWM